MLSRRYPPHATPAEYREGQCRVRTGRADDTPACYPSIFAEFTEERRASGRQGHFSSRSPMLGSGTDNIQSVDPKAGGYSAQAWIPFELSDPIADGIEDTDDIVAPAPFVSPITGYDEMARRIREDSARVRYESLNDTRDLGYPEMVTAPLGHQPVAVLHVATNRSVGSMLDLQGIAAPVHSGHSSQQYMGQEPMKAMLPRGMRGGNGSTDLPTGGGSLVAHQMGLEFGNPQLNLKPTGAQSLFGGVDGLTNEQMQFDPALLVDEKPLVKRRTNIFDAELREGGISGLTAQQMFIDGHLQAQELRPANFEGEGFTLMTVRDEGQHYDRFQTRRSNGQETRTVRDRSAHTELSTMQSNYVGDQVVISSLGMQRRLDPDDGFGTSTRPDVGLLREQTQRNEGLLTEASFFTRLQLQRSGQV